MISRKVARIRRAKRSRMKIKNLGAPRLSVFRSLKYVHAQVISKCGGKVLASASSSEKQIRELKLSGIAAASKVGEVLAERAVAAGIEKAAFDRSGYKYHGKVKALSEAARSNGLMC